MILMTNDFEKSLLETPHLSTSVFQGVVKDPHEFFPLSPQVQPGHRIGFQEKVFE